MNNSEQFKAFAKSKYAWPGGYPLFAITNDGGCLCHKCSKDKICQMYLSYLVQSIQYSLNDFIFYHK